MAGIARIGISGWRYPPWRGTFYPEGLAQHRELEHASRRLATIEINGSFYSLQRPSSWRAWRAATPEGFVFSVKGGRYLTHILRLRDCRTALANFFASGVLALGPKLGPFLWQLPPQLKFDPDLLDAFLALLPRTTTAAAALARGHNDRLKFDAVTEAEGDAPLRHTLEVRHGSFVDPRFVELLRRRNVALCVADSAGRWPHLEDLTADFVYVRLHGRTRLYASGYSSPALDRWAARIRQWLRGEVPADGPKAAPAAGAAAMPRDVYVYFDNDSKIRAPYDAMNLAARLHGGERVRFPRARAARRAEEPRTTWDVWARRPRRRSAAKKAAVKKRGRPRAGAP